MTYTVVTSGSTASNAVLNNDDTQQITQGGLAVGTVINDGGEQDVFGRRTNFGSASSTTINSGGVQDISAGTADSTTVNAGGTQIIENNSLVTNTTVSGVDASATVTSGGALAGATIAGGGTITAATFGLTTDVTVSSGGLLSVSAGSAMREIISSGGSANVVAGGVLFSASVLDGGLLYVGINGTDSGGSVINSGGLELIDGGGAESGVVSSGGVQIAQHGGNATNAVVVSGGLQVASSGGAIQFTSVGDGGQATVSSGGAGVHLFLKAGAVETVLSGGTDNGTVVSGGGLLEIMSGGDSDNSQALFGGVITLSSGAVTHGTYVAGAGTENVSAGAIAYSIYTSGGTINDDGQIVSLTADAGTISVTSGASATGTYLRGGGNLGISSGATATGTRVDAGTERVYVGGTETNGTLFGGVQIISGTVTSETVYGGTEIVYGQASGTVMSGGTVKVQNTGVSIDETISAGTEMLLVGGTSLNAHVVSAGVQSIYGGSVASGAVVSAGGVQNDAGTAVDTVVGSGGAQYVQGVASNTTVASGGLQNVQGGTATNTTAAGTLIVAAGSTVNATLTAGAIETVSSGAAASGTVVGSGATVSAVGGLVSGATVASGGVIDVFAGGVASAATLSAGATQLLYSGGTAADMVILGGTEIVSSGAVDLRATVSAGVLTVASSGTATSTVVLAGATETVLLSGTANSALINGGTQILSAGAFASATTVQAGGDQQVLGGALASGTVLAAGTQEVSSLGVASATVISNGGVETVFSGGLAGVTTVSAGGTLVISSGGTATGTLLSAGGALINHGVTSSTSGTAVIGVGGDASIYNDGVIIGTNISAGVAISVAGGTVTNAGTLIGLDGTAIAFGGTTTNRLIVTSDSVISGVVSATAAASNTLELSGINTGATLSNYTTQYLGFQTLQVDSGSTWDVAGNINLGTVVNGGTLLVSTTDTLHVTSATGSGSYVVAGHGVLEFDGAVDAGQVVLSGTTAKLIVADPANFSGTVSGLARGDIIDLNGVPFSGAAATLSGNTITVQNGASTYTIQLAAPIPDSALKLSADANGKLQLTLVPPVTEMLAHDTGASPTDLITNNPTLTGLADPNATVILSEGATVLGSATANAGGVWSFNPTLADGAHVIVATDTDAGNNTGSATLSLTLDTVPPVTPTVALTSGSDSNVVGDDITNVNTPTLTGTGETGATIVLTDAGVPVGTATVVAGAWSIALGAPLVDGAHTLHVTESDTAGNTATADLSVTIDTTAPVVPVLSLDSGSDTGVLGDNITQATTPAITGSGGVGDVIELYSGATLVGSGTVAANGTFSVAPTTALSDGTYTFTVSETDAAGNSTTSASLAVTVDTTADGAPTGLALLAADDTGTQGDGITTFTQPVITGSGTAGDSVTLYDGATLIGTGTVGVGGTFAITPTGAFSLGAHTITATQTDAAGNVSAASTAFNLTVSATPPTPSAPSLAVADDTGTVGDDITSVTQPAIVGTGAAGDTITLYDGNTVIGTAVVAQNGSFSVVPTAALTDGVHSLTITDTDAAANVSGPSAALSLTINTTVDAAPTALVLDPASDSGTAGDDITNATMPTITGSGVAGDTVTLFDGVTAVGTAIVAGNGTFSVAPSSALADGVHSFTVTQTNAAGNPSTASAALSVTIDTALPATLSTPTLDPASDSGSGSGSTNVSTPIIQGTGVAGDTVTLFDNGTAIGTAVIDQAGNFAVSPGTALADGPHTLTTRQTDSIGNQSVDSPALALTIDTVAPLAPVPVLDAASDSGVSHVDRITNVTQPAITGAGSPGDTIKLYEGNVLIGTGTVAPGGTFSVTPTAPLADGVHTFKLTATDAAANVSTLSAALSVTIDTVADAAPTLSALALASDSGVVGDNLTNVTHPAVTGTGVVNHTVTLYDGGVAVGTAVVGSNGKFSVAPTPALADGVHQFTVKQVDLAGNLSAASSQLSVTVDTVADAAPTGLTLNPADDSGTAGDNLTNAVQPTITGQGVAGDTVTLFDGASVIGSDVVASDGTFSITLASALAEGVHTLTAQETNVAGNVSVASTALGLTIDTTAPAVPTPTLSAANDSGTIGDRVTNFNQPAIVGTGTAGDVVTLYDGATVIGSAVVGVSGAFSVTPTAALADGIHALRLDATDPAGNTSSLSAPFSLTVDTTADAAPSNVALALASDSGVVADNLTNVTLPAITGVGAAGHLVTLYDGATNVGTAVVGSNGKFSVVPTTPLTEGTHDFTLKQTDIAGNVSAASQTLSVTIDTTADAAPAGLTLNPADDSGLPGDHLTNVTQPTITGTGTAGSTATLYDGATAVGSIMVAADGTFAVTPTSTLSEGLHSLTVREADPAGNVSASSSPLVLTIDTTPPLVTAPVLAPASDTGTLGDAITSVVRPAITGTGVAGDVVTLHDGAAVIGTATIGQAGTYSITPATALADGIHSLTITAVDPAGNTSLASTPLALTIDTIADAAPTGFVLAPASDSGVAGDNLTSVTAPALTGTGIPGHTVTLYEGTTALGSAVVGSNGVFSVAPSSPLADGVHNFQLTVTDPSGNVSARSLALPVTIDTAADAAPGGLVLALASDSGVVGDHVTNITTPVITGTGVAGDTVTLFDGLSTVGTATVAVDGKWSVTTTSLAAGLHSLTATQTDAAGNVSPATVALGLTIDTTVPAAPGAPVLALASDSGVAGDNVTNVTAPLITGSGVAGDTVTLFDGATAVGSAVVDGTGAWSVTTSPLAAGLHNLTATQTELAGNVSVASAPLALTIATTVPVAPGVPVLAAASDSGMLGDRVTNVAAPVITGSGVAGDTVTLFDGTTAIGSAIVDGTGAWSVTASPLADGVHAVTATQTDAVGNVSAVSGALALTIATAVPAVPATLSLALASDSGVVGDRVTNVTTPVITGTGVAGDTVTLFDGLSTVGTATVAVDGKWSVTTTSLAAGLHSLTATQTDAAGNVSPATAALGLTIDTTVPAAPGALVLAAGSDSGVVGDRVTNVTSPVITGSGMAGDTVTLFDGATAIGSAVVDGTGAWSVTTSPLAAGSHTLTATQTELAGNVSVASAPLALTIATALPAAPGVPVLAAASDSGVVGDNVTNVAAPVITGSGMAGDTVTLFDGTTAIGSAVVSGTGAWSVTASHLTDGVHALTATQTDAVGNVSAASGALALTIATAVPAVPATLNLASASDSGVVGDHVTNVTTPVITGNGVAGDTVTLFDGLSTVGTAIVAATGNWSVTTTSLAAGLHSLTATQTDAAGNVSPATAALGLTIDATVPAAPGAPVLASASDSGVAGDNVTNVTAPVITGAGMAGDTVTLFDGAIAIGSAVVDGTGAWSVTTSPLAAGLHNLTATQTEVAGNVSVASAPLALTIATASPSTPTLGRAPAATDPAKPVIGGAAQSGSTVNIFQDGNVIGAVTAVGGAWTFSYPAALAAGQYALDVTATDAAGNVSDASAPLELTINADNSYAVKTSTAGSATTTSYNYTSAGLLSTIDTNSTQGGQLLTSVSNTAALINIYDTAGTLIGTITQPSTSAYSLPVFDTTPKTLAASTGSGPIGSVVDLLSETNNFVSQGNDTITVHSGTATIAAMGPSTVVNNVDANLTFYGNASATNVFGGNGTITAIGGTGGGTLIGGLAGNNVLVAGGGTTTLVGVAAGDTLFGSDTGTDTLSAGGSGETLVGGGGTETLVARAGSVAFGGSGNSTLFSGDEGGSILVGGSGTSVLVAGAGNEEMWGGSGYSTLWGGSGSDVLGGNGDINSNTVMIGGVGNDVFVASAGTNTIYGGKGNDLVWGGSGNLTIHEGNGNDTVAFGTGTTTVDGGAGTNVYVLINGRAGGNDVINNFKVGTDHLSLNGYDPATVNQSVIGGNTVVSLSDHSTITLVGVTEHNISSLT